MQLFIRTVNLVNRVVEVFCSYGDGGCRNHLPMIFIRCLKRIDRLAN